MKKTRRPFCNRELMEAYKAMKRRELIRQGKPVPATLMPSPEATTDRHGQQRLPFSTEASR